MTNCFHATKVTYYLRLKVKARKFIGFSNTALLVAGATLTTTAAVAAAAEAAVAAAAAEAAAKGHRPAWAF